MNIRRSKKPTVIDESKLADSSNGKAAKEKTKSVGLFQLVRS